jgi:hypothetical protein
MPFDELIVMLSLFLILQYFIFYLKVADDIYPNKKQMIIDFIPYGMYFQIFYFVLKKYYDYYKKLDK